MVCPPSYKFFDSIIPVPSEFESLKPFPSRPSVWANVPVEIRRAVKSLVDVLLPMDSREAIQLWRAAKITIEFFKLARIASFKDIAIEGRGERQTQQTATATINVLHVNRMDMAR